MNISALSSFAPPPSPPDWSASGSAETSHFGALLADSLKANAAPSDTQTRFTAPPVAGHTQVEKQSEFTNLLRGSSPEDADKIVRDMTYEDRTTYGGLGPALNISGLLPGGDGIIRYTGTGEPVTPESQALFNAAETSFRKIRMNIYESETAKGTPPAEIYAKLVSALGQQPEPYRSMVRSAFPA